MGRPYIPLDQVIERHSIPEPNSGCWLWTAAVSGSGPYGRTTKDGKTYPAHRLSYQIYRGPVRSDQVVCHKCDNPYCVNPEHLFIGTQKDNVHDAIRKGRFPFRRRVLTPAQEATAKVLFYSGLTRTDIGRRLGVSTQTITRSIYGRHRR